MTAGPRSLGPAADLTAEEERVAEAGRRLELNASGMMIAGLALAGIGSVGVLVGQLLRTQPKVGMQAVKAMRPALELFSEADVSAELGEASA